MTKFDGTYYLSSLMNIGDIDKYDLRYGFHVFENGHDIQSSNYGYANIAGTHAT